MILKGGFEYSAYSKEHFSNKMQTKKYSKILILKNALLSVLLKTLKMSSDSYLTGTLKGPKQYFAENKPGITM